MLPPGHFAAGYLAAQAIINLAKPALATEQINWLLFLGAFFGFAPDLDMFYAFIKERGLRHTGKNFNHREFLSHTPVIWLCLGIVIALLGQNLFWRYVGLLIWVGSWSHFLLDSTHYGIRWLYPFSKKFYALKNAGQIETNTALGFFKHWWNLVVIYHRLAPLTFYAEIIIIIAAILNWLIF